MKQFDWKKRQAELDRDNHQTDYKFVFIVALILMLFTASEFRHCESEAKSTRNTDQRIIDLSKKLDKLADLETRLDLIAISR